MALVDVAAAWINKDDNFTHQIAGACLTATRDIENEDPGTGNHANRIVWAGQVKENPIGKAIEMLRDVAANATVAAALPVASDSDVQFVVNSVINDYATGA